MDVFKERPTDCYVTYKYDGCALFARSHANHWPQMMTPLRLSGGEKLFATKGNNLKTRKAQADVASRARARARAGSESQPRTLTHTGTSLARQAALQLTWARSGLRLKLKLRDEHP